MKPALSVRKLCKEFPDFALKDITFEIPQGTVFAIIGENGSGKSTTLECILGQDIPTSGEIEIYGINPFENIEAHALVGAAFDSCLFPETFTPAQTAQVLSGVYSEWDQSRWEKICTECEIPMNRKIRTFSRGMKAKLSLAAALSHHAKLLILDEATAGLDPVIREEMIDQLLEFMQEEDHAILMTSHISSDLERIADYIVFIRDGQIVFTEDKEKLLSEYGLASVTSEQLEFVDPALICRIRKQAMSTDLLVGDRTEFRRRYPDYALKAPSLDEIVLMFTRGEEA